MVRELSGLPLEIVGSILAPFCRPIDLAELLAASRGLRSLRQACVTSLLEKLFEGKPGASNALLWIRRQHHEKVGKDGPGLDDVGLVDWLYGVRGMAATGAYRASLGECHTVVVTPGGRALAAGSGRNGVLGASGNMNRFLFTEVDLKWGRFPGRVPVAAVACGTLHTLILTAVGTVHSCGLGDYGRLGHGSEDSLSRPTLIESLVSERITQIAAGQAHSVAVSWKGEAFTWGWGFQHVLGHGDELDRLEPTRLSIPSASGEPAVGGSESAGAEAGGSGGAELVGARGSVGVAGGDRVTCAAAGRRCTMLGTRRGRVLATGLINNSGAANGGHPREFYSALLSEVGRVNGGCWRVQCVPAFAPGVESMLVIDSAGQAYELSATEEGSLRGSRRWKQQRVASHRGCGRDGRSGGGVSSSGGGTAVDTASSFSTKPPPRQLRVAPPFARCSSVLISPAVEGTRLSWAECGSQAHGNAEAYVAVASDGCLLSSPRPRAGETVDLQRGNDDGVVHASAWVDFRGDGAHGLLLVDGGASVITHGYGRTGHLGHGNPGYVRTPKIVTTAVVLGSVVRGHQSGVRSASVQISIGAGAGAPLEPEVGGDAARNDRGRGGAGLLALVDASADMRDLEDGRPLAEDGEDAEDEEPAAFQGLDYPAGTAGEVDKPMMLEQEVMVPLVVLVQLEIGVAPLVDAPLWSLPREGTGRPISEPAGVVAVWIYILFG
eukprot:g5396.t1